MSDEDLSGYEVEFRRNTTQIKMYDAPDRRDHEPITAHLPGRNTSGTHLDLDAAITSAMQRQGVMW